MTKTLSLTLGCVVVASYAMAAALTDKPATIYYPAGHYLEGWPRQLGTDLFGYNYQAHKFNGSFANVYLGGDGLPPYMGDELAYYEGLVAYGYAADFLAAAEMMAEFWYWPDRDVALRMEWNDAWLSNKDLANAGGNAGSDGNLDRHRGYPTYRGSGAWLTNHRSGVDSIEHKGKTKNIRWSYFIKMVAVPSTAYLEDGFWYTEEGTLIGEDRFGNFAAVQIISNDKLYNERGLQFRSPAGPGYGIYGPE